MKLEELYVYDIETYPNCFTMYIGNAETRDCWGFEISERKDERQELFSLLRSIVREKACLVGFNVISFDYPVLHKLLLNQNMTVKEIYDFAMEVISADGDDKFKYIVRDKDVLIPQIDLYKIHHFDNNARATSLKMLEFNMRSKNIKDLPFEPGTILKPEQIDTLLTYNKHDMSETCKFLSESLEQIDFREELTKTYNRNFLNHNDTKIGKDYFIMKLEESNPGCCYVKTREGRKPRQTIRSKINLEDCILPYTSFKRPEFQAVLDWLCKQTITETKGVFTDILESDLGELAKYANMRTKKKKLQEEPTEEEMLHYKKELPLCWAEPVELKSGKVNWYLMWRIADNLNCVVDGLQYDYGTGGLHASIESQTIYSDDEYIIVDQDVASYYPNLAIKNNLYPEHMGEHFCTVYEDVYNQRKRYKKGTLENAMMKLALNGVYGASNDQFSPFLDPKFTMSITIGGQLSLSMLAEMLLEVPTLTIAQCNTDGLTYRVKREYKDRAQEICNEWENITKLTLEDAEYELMAIRDVNNYLSKTFDGKVKSKGAYQFEGLGWHQNQSFMVIPLAAKAAIIDGVDIEDFILNHEDIYDFMGRTKVPRSSRMVGEVHNEDGSIVEEKPLQNICRYYVSGEGVSLTKIMPPIPGKEKQVKIYQKDDAWQYATTKTAVKKFERLEWDCVGETEERRIGINTGWKVTVCNDIDDFKDDINYEFYIREVKKLVDPLHER